MTALLLALALLAPPGVHYQGTVGTGAVQWTPPGPSYVGAGAISCGGGGGTYTPALPGSTAAGDIFLALVFDSSGAVAAPGGWTRKVGDANGINIYWKRAAGGDTATTFNEGGYGCGFVFAIRNAIGSGDPFDVAGSVTTVFSTGANSLPAVTVAANSWVSIFTATGGTTATMAITSTPCPTQIASGGPTGGGNLVLKANTASAPSSAGSTGTSTFTNGGNGSQASAVYFAIKAQ